MHHQSKERNKSKSQQQKLKKKIKKKIKKKKNLTRTFPFGLARATFYFRPYLRNVRKRKASEAR